MADAKKNPEVQECLGSSKNSNESKSLELSEGRVDSNRERVAWKRHKRRRRISPEQELKGNLLRLGKEQEEEENQREGEEVRAEGPSSGYTSQLPRKAARGNWVPRIHDRSGCVELQADSATGSEKALTPASNQWAPNCGPMSLGAPLR